MNVSEMKFSKVFPALIAKAERKGRTREEVFTVMSWLTGYTMRQLDQMLADDTTYGSFLMNAPGYTPLAAKITGKVCGIQVETIEDPFMKRVRQLDKLVDELAKGKSMDVILRK